VAKLMLRSHRHAIVDGMLRAVPGYGADEGAPGEKADVEWLFEPLAGAAGSRFEAGLHRLERQLPVVLATVANPVLAHA
jgi:hypothetical protein